MFLTNNSVIVILDEVDKVVYQKRLTNDLATILKQLSVYKSKITAIAIESTFNWYWLVDGLMEAGYAIKLVNTAEQRMGSAISSSQSIGNSYFFTVFIRKS